ncbi:MAG: LysM peptidoglycan-binding domain-containing protein [Candidatus Nanopelagicales bacterium]
MSASTHDPSIRSRCEPSSRTRGAVLRAALAAVVLGAIVLGVPAMLIWLGTALPLDAQVLRPGALLHADDGRLLLLVILGIAWIGWAATALSLATEAWSVVRHVPTPRLAGLALPQRAAASLISALVIGIGSGASFGPVAADTLRAEVDLRDVVATASAPVPQPASGSPRGVHGEPPERSEAASSGALPRGAVTQPPAPTITTQRHDTLWLLAEQLLGRGERFTEIVDLNLGITQPDGRSLGRDGRLYPGWTLILPSDARVDSSRPDRHAVAAGDTLWKIAQEELGDPTLYRELFEANEGDLQPDGRRLTDPDLIRPGWVLEVPLDLDEIAPSGAAAGDDASDQADAADRAEADPDGSSAELVPPLDRAQDPARDRRSDEGPPAIDRGEAAPESEASADTGADSTTSRDPAGDGAEQSGASPSASPTGAASSGASNEASADADQSPESSVDDAGRDATYLLPAGGAVAALLLAGVAGEIARRRRQFQRYRRPGERMPALGADARLIEDAARSASAEPGNGLLDRALTQLAHEAWQSGQPVPDVRLVRVSGTGVVLQLTEPAAQAVSPFIAVSDAVWELDRTMLGAESPDHPRAYPALVTLGTDGDDIVLLNAESVGTLGVHGESDHVADVLRAFSAELAFGPASRWTTRTFCLSDTTLADAVEAGSVTVEASATRARRALEHRITATRRMLDREAAVDSRRLHLEDAFEAEPVEVVLADAPVDVDVPPWCGAVLMTSAPGTGAGAILHLAEDGRALLTPDEVWLRPQSLPARSAEQLADVLRATDLPAGCEPASPVDAVIDLRDPSRRHNAGGLCQGGGLPAGPADAVGAANPGSHACGSAQVAEEAHIAGTGPAARDACAGGVSASAFPQATAPRILVLGEVRVENAYGKAESSRIGRLSETAAFVFLNPGTRPSDLQAALWPGRRSNPQTCRQMISRTRTWLGRTDAGEPYLMAFTDSDGRLRMRPEVTCDWAEFEELAVMGLADPDDVDHLTSALSLVRGRPFGAVASRELPWADLHINDMVSLITDVAHELATRHLAAGRIVEARGAALRGLLTQSEAEVLEEVLAAATVV